MAKKSDAARAARAERLAEAKRKQAAAERRRTLLTIGGVVGVLVLVLGIGFWIQQSRDSTGDAADSTPSVASSASDDGTPGELDGYGIVIGEPEAETTVTIYEDLQCPACQSLEASLGDQINAAIEAGDIKVDYHMVAFLDQASTNEYSSRALNAALVVLDTAGATAFKEFHDTLYANQPAEGGDGHDDDALIEFAVDSGAVESEIRQPIEDKVFEQWIKNATDQMSKDGVNSTPSIRIDGEDADAGQLATLLQQ